MGHSPALQNTPQASAGSVSAESMARVGTRVGGCEITAVIGEGGTGVVYRGRQVASDRLVAIKILHDRGARQKDVVEQFIGEARATSRIHHTNVIDVIDLGTTPDGTVYLVMEYLEGESLRNRLNLASRLPLFEAINILRQVARGLGAAHAAGIVHGGLKPADIFLCRRKGRRRIVRRSKAHGMRLVVEPEENYDLVKLLDFGMARFLDLAPGAQAPVGSVSGTLHYLSPEQAQGQPADQRSDIYSLGAVFYEMVTGAVPFGGESLLDILRGHVSGQVIAPSRRTPGAGIHMRIDALILRCLKKSPTLRFASTGELCEALDDCITDCAFLRDAHRLPGIGESGIDLSEVSREARQDDRAQFAEKPAAAAVAREPAVAAELQRLAAASVVVKPVVAPMVRKAAGAPMADNSAAAVVTPSPTAVVADLAAGASTADLPAEISAGLDDPLSRMTLVRSAAIVADVDQHPARLDLVPISRRPQVIVLVGVLILGGVGIAVSARRGGLGSSTMKPVVALQISPVPTTPPPPLAAVPVAAPAAPADPAEPAPAIALPRPEPPEPVETARAKARAQDRLTPARPRAAQASNPRTAARAIPTSPETAPTPPVLASAGDFVREAQHAWMAGHHALAISKAQVALKAAPNPAQAAQAYELIATCACAIGQTDVARESALHLSDSKREAVSAMCLKNGVTIE
jgi:serine/threonine protein kinase